MRDMTEPRANDTRAVVNAEVPRELKERLVEYATDAGLSQTAVLVIALNDWLTRNGYPRKTKR
jgi:hypothetical protein